MQFLRLYHSIFQLRLSPSEFVVLTYLLKFGKQCWPSHAKIATETSQSVRTVKRSLCSLKERNLIDWKSGYTGRSNHYVINFPQKEQFNHNADPVKPAAPNDFNQDFGEIPDAKIDMAVEFPKNQFSTVDDFLKNLGITPESESNYEQNH